MAGVEGARGKVAEVGSERLVVQNLQSGGSRPELRVLLTRGAFYKSQCLGCPSCHWN